MSLLNANKRDINIPNSAKKSRKLGKVPGVLYSKKMKNLLFEVGDLEFDRELHITGEHGIMNVDIDGKTYKTLIKEVQRDPVSRKVIHVDLESISDKDKIISQVPIQFIGEEYLQKRGSVLQKERETIKVECAVEDLPKSFTFDVGRGQVGDVYKLTNLEVGDEISIVDDLNSVLASVSYERMMVSDVTETDEEEDNKEEK